VEVMGDMMQSGEARSTMRLTDAGLRDTGRVRVACPSSGVCLLQGLLQRHRVRRPPNNATLRRGRRRRESRMGARGRSAASPASPPVCQPL
jgi:hypothetical protein